MKLIVTCQYCNNPSKLVIGKELYPHRPDLYSLKFWQCKPCNAYVGCHKDSNRPKGSLANKPTREARKRAHAAFDPLWKSGQMKRGEAYKWLSEKLGKQIHIGESDVEMCNKVISEVTAYADTF